MQPTKRNLDRWLAKATTKREGDLIRVAYVQGVEDLRDTLLDILKDETEQLHEFVIKKHIQSQSIKLMDLTKEPK